MRMGAVVKIAVFVLTIFFQTSAISKVIDRCGIYQAQGYYTEIESVPHNKAKKKVILVERGTDSEITFYINNKKLPDLLPETHLGVNFSLKLKIVSSCWFHCEGEVVEVFGPLDPTAKPAIFLFPRPNLIPGTELKCQSNSMEDR